MASQSATNVATARVTELRQEAEKVSRQIRIDPNAPVRRYFNGANSLLEQGRQCKAAQDWERAFTLLMRFATYFLEMMPDHPGYKHADMATQRSRLKKECKVRAAPRLRSSVPPPQQCAAAQPFDFRTAGGAGGDRADQG